MFFMHRMVEFKNYFATAFLGIAKKKLNTEKKAATYSVEVTMHLLDTNTSALRQT